MRIGIKGIVGVRLLTTYRTPNRKSNGLTAPHNAKARANGGHAWRPLRKRGFSRDRLTADRRRAADAVMPSRGTCCRQVTTRGSIAAKLTIGEQSRCRQAAGERGTPIIASLSVDANPSGASKLQKKRRFLPFLSLVGGCDTGFYVSWRLHRPARPPVRTR